MEALSAFFAMINPWAGLFVQAVTMVEALAAQAPQKPTGPQKKSAAVDAVVAGINALPTVTAGVVDLQAALKTNDPATVATGLGHSVEMALSICKAFGIFSKAAVVQNAPSLIPNASESAV